MSTSNELEGFSRYIKDFNFSISRVIFSQILRTLFSRMLSLRFEKSEREFKVSLITDNQMKIHSRDAFEQKLNDGK